MPQFKEQEKAKLWLTQFDNKPANLAIAEKLLDSVNYCPVVELKSILIKLLRQKLPLKSGSRPLFP